MTRSQLRCRSEAGATMVEGAIVATLIALVLTCIFGGALYVRAYNATSSAASDGARAGSIGAADKAADWDVLQAARRDIQALGSENLQRVVVYKASGPTTEPPAACATAAAGAPSIYGICNVYLPADLDLNEAAFILPSNTHDDSWPAASRSDSRSGGSDWIGVQVITNCGCFLENLGFEANLSKWSTMQLESHTS